MELLAAEELCVCHLVELLAIPQPLVSHHLRALRQAGLVESERFRYWTYYRLRSDALIGLGRELSRLAETVPPDGTPRRPCC
jgi:ArsR family transcriptional regulator